MNIPTFPPGKSDRGFSALSPPKNRQSISPRGSALYGLGRNGWQEYGTATWQCVWLISYPRWCDSLEPYDDDIDDHATWERLSERVQERANRRWQKKARKAARLNDTRAHTSMSGAWPQ